MERRNAVTMHGEGLTLTGEEIKPGTKAPDFNVIDTDLNKVSLGDLPGTVKVIASVPSLDTPVCDLEIKNFNEKATRLSGEVGVSFISMDLPFAQKRFCESFDIDRVRTYSDHLSADFGEKYGVLIKELRLLARAVFVLDKDGTVAYVQHVKELTEQPDLDAVLSEIEKLV